MRTRLLHTFLQSLLILFSFWLSLIRVGTSASPVPLTRFHARPLPLQRRTLHQLRSSSLHLEPRVPPSPPPNVQDLDPNLPLAAAYNLKFKKYSQWIKEQSKSLWDSHKDKVKGRGKTNDYVSPFLTRFSEKHDSLWSTLDLGRMWKHFIWEALPEWWRGHDAPIEDVFLLRAMEQPVYMSVDELPEMFRVQVSVQEEEEIKDGSRYYQPQQ
ncbi:hypothetical protein P691DRAFT_801760 [Macrolepiota fuliginosa MF-IS2]|uniref:Uncharacterized protein n=1 Tax=Macrolepiota fuliginosa MF-IS2 TaxID=1400762 RepID=A0A9P5XE06_9AGAR|nr:hypothetical protein P691DRAFT_801760 [Macrolepiota fuliginosa MF-IS2]